MKRRISKGNEILRRVKLAALAVIIVWSLASVIDSEAHKSEVAEYGKINIFRIIDAAGNF